MKAEELLDLIKRRRAVMPARYAEAEITKSELDMILEAANWAPTHKRTEPWRYRIISGEGRKRFSEFMASQYAENTAAEKFSRRKSEQTVEKCLKSDKIILISVQNSGKVPEWEETAAVAASVQNMWLMCTLLGIGSYWSTPAAIRNMPEFTGFEENEKCIGIFYMGRIQNTELTGRRDPIDDKINFINY